MGGQLLLSRTVRALALTVSVLGIGILIGVGSRPPTEVVEIVAPSRCPEPLPTLAPTPSPTPTATPPLSSAVDLFGDRVDLYRISDGFKCGGSPHDCMEVEPEAIMLARIAIGEAPEDLNDRIYVIWLIRLRADLGFKNARLSGGWRYVPGRWGEPTTIRREALCDGGCQFSPARVAQRIYYPCLLSDVDPMRKMLCPTDDQLADFDATVRAAERILLAPLSEFPVDLRGYDNFRSPSITGPGQFNRQGGMKSVQFFRHGNIWRDEFLDDNLFWDGQGEETTRAPIE